MDLLGRVLHSILYEADRGNRELGLQQYREEVGRKPKRWQEIYQDQLNRLLSKPRFPRRVSWLLKLIHGRGWGRSWFRTEVHAEGVSIRIIPKHYLGVPVAVGDAVCASVSWNSNEKVWELHIRGLGEGEPVQFYNLLPALIVGLRVVNGHAPEFDHKQWKSYQERLGKLERLEPTALSLHSQAAFAADHYLALEIDMAEEMELDLPGEMRAKLGLDLEPSGWADDPFWN